MTIDEFKSKMLEYACAAAEALCTATVDPAEKLEPEQVRKNVATIHVILTETEDFLRSLNKNTCSDSD